MWHTLINNLVHRVQLLSKAKEGDELLIKAKQVDLMLEDSSWPFQQWCGHKKQLIQSPQKPKNMEAMLANLNALEDCSRDPSLVTSFQQQVPMDFKVETQKEVKVFPWRLQLNPREDDPWNLLVQLQGNAVWNLIGLRYKQATMKQSQLAQQVESNLKALR